MKSMQVSSDRVYLSVPHMGSREIEYVAEAFRTNWISCVGPILEKFEQALAEYVGVNAALAVSSGTSAVHLSLKLAGIEAGDLVICSSFTFSRSPNPIFF